MVMDDELGISGRIETYDAVLLGRIISSIEFSKNDSGDYTNTLVVKFNDGGFIKILESDSNLLLSPPVDSIKCEQFDDWRKIMPLKSYEMIEKAKKAQKEGIKL